MIGDCCIRHYSKTQTTVSLSSGEAELHGIAQGAANALGVQALLLDMGWQLKCNVHSDATTAIGICRRKGLGKVRHLDCTDLWIQESARAGRFAIHKVEGAKNPADILTKYLDRATMELHLKTLGMRKMLGRPACAPAATGVTK